MNNVKIIKMPKKFEASYVLEDSLDRILYTINFKQFELITNETSLKNIFTNEPIETPFSYRINELSLYDSSKLFSIIITHQNIPCEIEVNLIFKENTLDKNTLLTLEIKLINTKFSYQHNLNKIVKGCQKLCIEYIRLIEKFLEQRTDHLYQTESTIIKVEKVKLFDFLISFKIFEPLFDVIVPDKNNIKKGSKIYFNCKKKNIIIENTVTKICIEPNKKKWYLNFVSKSDYFKTQEIMIYLISLSENLTFISITHHFKESTKLEEIQEIENKKKNLFVKIKQIFEDNQKDSLNEETTFTDKTDHNSESKSFDERLMKNYFENQSEKDYY
jgi:hypothetical protein